MLDLVVPPVDTPFPVQVPRPQGCLTCLECGASERKTSAQRRSPPNQASQMADRKVARRRRWWRLRQRWRMVGVFEVNQDNEFYHLTSMIKEGMHASIQAAADTSGQEPPAAAAAAAAAMVERSHEARRRSTDPSSLRG
ncbi:hypothetical protein EYF80_066569 [Liparis tanakae]|uniref:Uncharacterized protein n=1 Tax=Liparis tanakae TaxID=230148 RepID=A0A4Z2E4Q5_9TELE|nr:hypothetical protein EYF80_066569 [Liparis tanakae]